MKDTGHQALVLIGTCNGERFLLEQIESILRQEGGTLHILIRDDRSDDATAAILEDLERRYETIEILTDNRGRVGYAQNFSLLMQEAYRRGARYVLLSDQDDLWHPHRGARQIAALERMERSNGPATPCLSHSDLQLIDEHGYVIAVSMRHEQGIRLPQPEQALAQLIAANYVTGCTIAMNQALLALATPVPAVIRHHDHWIALCAAACGMIESDTAALVQYRQHGANAIGGRKLWRSWRAKPSRLAVKIRHHRDDIRRLPELLDALQQRCGSEAPEHARSLLAQAETVAARRTSGLARYNGYKRLGIAPHDGARHLLWLMKNLIS